MHHPHFDLTILLLGSLLVAFFLAVPCALASEAGADEPRRIHTADARKQGVGQNIDFVEKLIHESAAAKQILESDNTEAKALRERALKYLDEARAAEVKGDVDGVAEALNKAKMAIFSGMRLVGGQVVKDKREENFEKKYRSLSSLLEAHERIRQEHDQSEALSPEERQAAEEVSVYTQVRMKEARTLLEKGNQVEAQNVLNTAYLSLKLSLTKLRDGKTMVRSLNFATKEDEYKYELRRNDTHMMLINTVLKEKRGDPRLGPLMNIPLKAAEKLRGEAEQQAASGDFERAIKTLEDSTKQIIRAIRVGGVFIPG